MGRELFISLGITILTSVTLFLYFRNRFKVVEHKVNTIFQLVQSHSRPQAVRQPPPSRCRPPPREMAPGIVLEEKGNMMKEINTIKEKIDNIEKKIDDIINIFDIMLLVNIILNNI